jgi:8-oxo-dGTP pyrophosphatase MutT (NUDIX family)
MNMDARVANVALLSGDDVLLLERAASIDNQGKFGLVGGIIDPSDSSPYTAVLRELGEETGLTEDHIEFSEHGSYLIIDHDSSNDVPDGRRLSVQLFAGRLLVARPRVQLRHDEHRRSIWVPADRIVSGAMDKTFYDRLLAGVPTLLSYALYDRPAMTDQTLERASLERLV